MIQNFGLAYAEILYAFFFTRHFDTHRPADKSSFVIQKLTQLAHSLFALNKFYTYNYSYGTSNNTDRLRP